MPLDVDLWPLHLIRNCRGFNAEHNRVEVNKAQVLAALRELLTDQWERFAKIAAQRDLARAADAFAAAVGVERSDTAPGDVAFGGIPRLLTVIEKWPGKVESDLNRFWNIDYRDRWRFDDTGQRRLTLRRIYARLSNLPADSALAIAMNDGKLHRTGAELLLMDLYEVLAGRRHPSRTMTDEQIAERDAIAAADEKARTAYQERMAKREERQMNSMLKTARENARISRDGAHAQEASTL